ncbi:nicotinate phosphoribosyltransferase [Microaerobacter geothermalis]|uniref:nicotinate phosphoribosyltransferase n=1 Tax=Microaerobacter geothermalis TaxID=674972 RepID=UPI001F200AD6|nr:nicotinate phosphoribosyltransferase [Microaerobacter geothermalis]MCF6094548.1 nicotinate phosphoribosyltransferase [Microaerobacter geothermalis]
MNLTMLTDFYELTMISSDEGNDNQEVVFDLYYRSAPSGNQFVIAAGLEQALEYLDSISFTGEDIDYLRSTGEFGEEFLERLRNFTFSCDVDGVPEGSVVFPNEPLLRIRGPWFEAQFVETTLTLLLNHQTLIATKAQRITQAAGDDVVLEFGARRAQGVDAALYGARAAYIGGCHGTSNVMAGAKFGIPIRGTHAHSWIQRHESELQAFRHYAEKHPENSILLVDTYDTLRSGIPNAIQVGKELVERGYRLKGIRLDSGDLAYLSKKARKMLDEAGFHDAVIVASSDLDEFIIQDLKAQGAKIDMWGVGTNLITSRDHPSLGCVYKLVAAEDKGKLVPKIKVSENPRKLTNPGFKKVLRLLDKNTKMALVDLIMLDEETVDPDQPLEVFDPVNTWKRKTVKNFEIKELLVPLFRKGKRVYSSPDISTIRQYAKEQLSHFSAEQKRLKNPHRYHVDLSETLWTLKHNLLKKMKEEIETR